LAGVERVWLPEWLHAREAVLDRLELAIADAQADDTNGEQIARVDSMVKQALEADAEFDTSASSAAAPALSAEPPTSDGLAEADAPNLSRTWRAHLARSDPRMAA
jgi:hypothetical protein